MFVITSEVLAQTELPLRGYKGCSISSGSRSVQIVAVLTNHWSWRERDASGLALRLANVA
jgi:hypothetical protein